MSVGQRLDLRLFMEGLEVPVISAMVSSVIGSHAVAQIEIVPTDLGMKMLARTKVHLLYYDSEEGFYSGAATAAHAESPERAEPGARTDTADQLYKLLFAGELMSLTTVKTGFGSRSLILQCVDDSNAWDTTYLYVLKYGGAGDQDATALVRNQAGFLGAVSAPFDDVGVGSVAQVVSYGLVDSDGALNPGLAKAKGVLGGLFKIFELVGGVHGKYVGANAWATITERRNRLLDQIASDTGATAQKLYQQAVFEDWVKNRIGVQGAVITFRDVIRTINSYIYYDVVPVPAGRYIPGVRTTPFIANPDFVDSEATPGADTSTALRPFRTSGKKSDLTAANSGDPKGKLGGLREEFRPLIEEVILRLQTGRGLDRSHAKTFLHVGRRGLSERNSIRQSQGRTSLPGGSSAKYAHEHGFAADLKERGLGSGFVYRMAVRGSESITAKTSLYRKSRILVAREAFTTKDELLAELTDAEGQMLTRLAAFYSDIGKAVAAVGSSLEWGGEWSGSPDPVWSLFGLGSDPVHVQLRDWATSVGGGAPTPPIQDSDTTASRVIQVSDNRPREKLVTQVFRPDVWFVSPPLCNVIFPEEYSSVSFSRNLLREVTRLQLDTSGFITGEDNLTKNYYFAPQIDDTDSLQEVSIGTSQAFVYPHEKFSGIIPRQEHMTDVAFYASKSGDTGVREDGTDGETPTLEEYAARTTEFNLLRLRYEARTVSVSGRFLPRVVAGFPALVVNRPDASSRLFEEEDGETLLVAASSPVHYLGLVQSVTHTLSQSGGQTALHLTHARSHKTGDDTDDLLSDLLYGGDVLSVQVPDKVETSYDVISGALLVSELLLVAQAQKFLRNSTPQEDLLRNPPSSAVGPKGGTVVEIRVETGDAARTVLPASGPTVDRPGNVLEGQDDFSVTGVGTAITKVTYVEESTAGTIPLEEAIRPPWFSDEYGNEKIGELYSELFGCKDLTSLTTRTRPGETMVSIETATEFVISEYSQIVKGGKPGNPYIHSVTKRGMATLPQVLGDVVENADGVAQQGFHAYCVGDYTGLEGLDLDDVLLDPLNPKESGSPIPANLDPRKERRRRVLEYRLELLQQRGLRG